MTDVLIVGAGPVGVMLAAELARLGVDAGVVEARDDRSAGTRAVGVHSAALTALEASGATDRLLGSARRVRTGVALARGRVLGSVQFDRLHARHPYVATLPQHATESALAATAASWGAPDVRRGITVQRVTPDGAKVAVVHVDRDGRPVTERASIVVIAAGSRGRTLHPLTAAVRTREYPDRYLMADAPDTSRDGDAAVVRLEAGGVLESFPLPGGMRRYVAWVETGGVEAGEAGADRLRAIVERRMGTARGADAITSASAFGVRRSLVPAMRRGAVFAIGDAAHEVSPIGGQGMNLGLIDASTLAPVLAKWVHTGIAPEEDIRAWERRRLAAANLSGRIAAANTALGRSAGGSADRARRAAVRAALRGRAGNILARAYAMDFDPSTASSRLPR